jgi:hypothetical protein
MVTTQVVLELSQTCFGAKTATEVVPVAVVEVVVPDLFDVFNIGGFGNVDFTNVNGIL